jgi:DNA-3-methyladenine glycosylase II
MLATTFSLTPRGRFSLAESSRFLCAFTPLSGSVPAAADRLRFAFLLDGSYAPVGVALSQDERRRVHGIAVGSGDGDAVARQVARILSLDHDGAGYEALGETDPVLERLQRARPGFRPVCFFSPFEAAVQAILGQRIPIAHAARLRARIAESLGERVTVDDETMAVLPHPEHLARTRSIAGVPIEKVARLRAVAEAAAAGHLDAERLRAMPIDDALAELRTIRGVGSWSAQHILVRGSGLADALPTAEPRVRAAAAVAYRRPELVDERLFTAVASGWRPYRTWVSVLLVAAHGFDKADARAPRRATA